MSRDAARSFSAIVTRAISIWGLLLLLILEEPTIGVDVGAKADIYHLLQLSLRRGLAVLLISSDFEEVERICHRALVFSRGQVAAEIPGHALTIAALTSAASGGTWTAPLGAQS